MFAGFAGSFFATRQGFISPESFNFLESAIILAIVVLGGMGSQIGVVIATIVLIGGPEWFRDLAAYRSITDAVRRGDEAAAGRVARALMQEGSRGVLQLLAAIEESSGNDAPDNDEEEDDDDDRA